MRADRLRFSAFALLLLAAAPASAADRSAAAPQERRELALDKAHEGLALFRAARWQEAHDRFREAEELHHAPTVVLYLARCQRRLGKLPDAQALYEQVVADPLPARAPAAFIEAHHDAERELGEVRAELAQAASAPREAPGPREREPERGGSLLPGVVALGVGAVGLAVGTVAGLVSLSQVSDLDARCPDNHCPASARGDANAAEALGNVSTVAFLAGGAALAAGAVLLVIRPGGGPAPAASGRAALAEPAARWSAGIGLGRLELRIGF